MIINCLVGTVGDGRGCCAAARGAPASPKHGVQRRAVSSVVEHRLYTPAVTGSNPVPPIHGFTLRLPDVGNEPTFGACELGAGHQGLQIGVVVQLVRTPACHAGGRGFESRRPRQLKPHRISEFPSEAGACLRTGRWPRMGSLATDLQDFRDSSSVRIDSCSPRSVALR